MQPRQRGHVRMEGVPSLVGSREGVLENLLRSLTITGQAVSRPVDGRAIASEELLEGVEVVCLDTAQQLHVTGTINCRRGASRSVVRRGNSPCRRWGPKASRC